MTPDNKYTNMQLSSYEYFAKKWDLNNRDPVVGSYDAHNDFPYYSLLFEGIENKKQKKVLDFACGPGRNIVKYSSDFERVDGVDISPTNIANAKLNLIHNNISNSTLYVNDGVQLNTVPSEEYDIVMSTIALQHICVYEIRYKIFQDIYRVLKNGGCLTAQMGYGSPVPRAVDYYANFYEAKGTNGACDVCVENYQQLQKDLQEIGFVNFTYTITPTGPGDKHPNWIFFRCFKQ